MFGRVDFYKQSFPASKMNVLWCPIALPINAEGIIENSTYLMDKPSYMGKKAKLWGLNEYRDGD